MIDQSTLVTYLVILLGFVFIPGPAVLLTLARSTSSGTRVGLATGVGIAVGDLVHTAMAVIGLSAIIMTSAFLFSVIKYLGAAYLIYLGIKAFIEKIDYDGSLPKLHLTPDKAFQQAVIAEVLNPKTALFFLSFLPQFVNPDNGMIALQLTVLGVLFVLAGLFTTVVVAISAGGVGRFFRKNPNVLRWQGKAVGCIYCGLGLRLAVQEK